MKRKTTVVNVHTDIPPELSGLSSSFSNVLSNIDSLYDLQVNKELSIREERSIWQEIPKFLKLAPVPESEQESLEHHIERIKNGIYDLYPITINTLHNKMDLVVGKVFTSEGDKTSYYSGVAGVVNNNYTSTLEQFDSKLDRLCEHLLPATSSKAQSIKDEAPSIKCLDVFFLAGALSVPHKPICIFFSGDNPQNISALSNMTVFINLYAARFGAISLAIAKSYIARADYLEELSEREISDLLLVWLRGHDVGHFIGEDKLGDKMSEFDKDYMILHELKSDMIALYSFELYEDDLLSDGLLERIYLLTAAEMLRYIRRGDLLKHPDSASAYLAWRYFESTGAIEYISDTKNYNLNLTLFKDSVRDFTNELLEIFKNGDPEAARELVGRFGSLENSDQVNIYPADCPKNLKVVLNDNSIAYYIDYNFLSVG